MNHQKLANYALILIGIALLAFLLQLFQAVMRPFAIAILLVFITTPLAEYSKRKGIPAWVSFLSLFVIVGGLLALASSFVTVDKFNLSGAIPEIQSRISESSGPLLQILSNLGFGLDSISKEDVGKIAAQGAAAGLGGVRSIFSETLLALILLMFILQSRTGLISAVEKKFGLEGVTQLQNTLRKIEVDILAYFGTKSLMSLGTAVLSVIVLLLFDAKFIAISGMLIFLLNFIPIVGSIIAVAVVVVLYLVSFGFSLSALWLFLSLLAVQVLFGNILEPKIAGEKLNMSPIVILVSLYVWGWIWGIVGMFLSVPLTIMILIMVRHLGNMRTVDA